MWHGKSFSFDYIWIRNKSSMVTFFFARIIFCRKIENVSLTSLSILYIFSYKFYIVVNIWLNVWNNSFKTDTKTQTHSHTFLGMFNFISKEFRNTVSYHISLCMCAMKLKMMMMKEKKNRAFHQNIIACCYKQHAFISFPMELVEIKYMHVAQTLFE